MKLTSFFVIFLTIFLSHAEGFAFNETAKGLLKDLFEKGKVANREELIAMLIPVAKDKTLTHMQKTRDMSYLVYISGWHISKEDKHTLFHDVHNILERQRKEDYLESHPDLDERTRDAIQSGIVLIGMSQESVKAILGLPEEIKPAIGTFANTEQWSYYSKRMVVYFKDGKLASFKKL